MSITGHFAMHKNVRFWHPENLTIFVDYHPILQDVSFLEPEPGNFSLFLPEVAFHGGRTFLGIFADPVAPATATDMCSGVAIL